MVNAIKLELARIIRCVKNEVKVVNLCDLLVL